MSLPCSQGGVRSSLLPKGKAMVALLFWTNRFHPHKSELQAFRFTLDFSLRKFVACSKPPSQDDQP